MKLLKRILKKISTDQYVYIGVFILFFFSFYSNKIIIDSRLDLNIDPVGSYHNFFWAWQNLLNLGQSNSWSQSYIFPFGAMYYFFSLIFSIHIVQALIFCIILWTGFYSFNKFIKAEFESASFYAYIGSLFYALNVYIATTISASYLVLLMNYAILPLQLYLLRKIFTNKKYFKYNFYFALAIMFMGGVNPPLIGINIIVVVFYLLHLRFNRKIELFSKSSLKKFFWIIVLSFGLNAFWLVPLLNYFLTLPPGGYNAILSEPLSMHDRISSFVNVLRTLGVWDFNVKWNGYDPSYPYASTYTNNKFLIFSLFLPLLFVMGGYIKFKDKFYKYISISVIMLVSIIMVVGINEGIFAPVYQWAYNHVPLFSMFRSGYKLISIYIFCLCYFMVFILVSIKNLKIKNLFFILFLIVILLNAFPFFNRSIIKGEKEINGIPSYYYDAKKFFDNDNSNYRIALLPEQYFSIYNWGDASGNPEIIWNKGLFTRQPGSALQYSNAVAINFNDDLLAGNYSAVDNILSTNNIKYIVERNDFNWQYYPNIASSPAIIKKALAPFQKVATFGELDIYKVADQILYPEIYSTNLTYQKVQLVKYNLNFKNVSSVQSLNFLDSYDSGWQLYLEKNTDNNACSGQLNKTVNTIECQSNLSKLDLGDIKFLFTPSVFDYSHTQIFGYANSWKIDPNYIKQNFGKQYYTVNADGSINFNLVLYFKPQSYFYVGILFTVLSIVVSLVVFIIKRNEN